MKKPRKQKRRKAPSPIACVVDRFGHVGAVREALLARPDLPLAARQSLVRQLSSALADFVADRSWLARDRAEEVGREACEKATVTIAALQPDHDVRPLVRHLHATGQLTAGLIMRALLSDNMAMVESALAELAALPLRRVRTLARDGGNASLHALFGKAGLPAGAYLALREVLTTVGEAHHEPPPYPLPKTAKAGEGREGVGRLRRRLVERALAVCERSDIGDLEPVLILLRRFAMEAVRDEAGERLLAEDRMEHGRAA